MTINSERDNLAPTLRMAKIKIKKTTTNVHGGVGKEENLLTGDGNVNWCGHHGNQDGGSSKSRTRTSILLSYHSWTYFLKTLYPTTDILAHPCSTDPLFIITTEEVYIYTFKKFIWIYALQRDNASSTWI